MPADLPDIPEPQPADRERFIHPMNSVELIRYAEQLRLAHGTVKLLGLPDVDERNDDLPLSALFVEPRVGPQQIGARGFDETAARATVPLLAALAEHPRLVLLGDPGAGKTTLLNWLCTALAQPLENEVTGTLGRLVPLPFILRDLPLGAALSWETLLAQFLARDLAAPLAKARPLLDQLLDSGQALILLDGIDEVGSVERREALRAAVWEGWKKWPRCRWVLTSRVVGYNEVFFDHIVQAAEHCYEAGETDEIVDWLVKRGAYPKGEKGRRHARGPGLSEHDFPLILQHGYLARRHYLAPFTDGQVRQFIENWFRLREPNPALAREITGNLISALDADAGTKELARIPNLLTLIALIYRVRAKLPDGRAELYAQIAAAYLKTIDEYRKLTDLPPYSLEEKMEWLARIGWEMQLARMDGEKRPTSNVQHPTSKEADADGPAEYLASGEEIGRWLEAAMRARFGAGAHTEARRFVDYIQRRTGLLLERGEGRFAFLHLSFQEFFAAKHLEHSVDDPEWAGANLFGGKVREDDPASLAALRGYTGTTHWQEVLVFLFESLGRKWAKSVLAALYPESGQEPKKCEPKDFDFSPESRARWLLAARLAGDPHVALSAEFRASLMRVCWRWELARCAERGPDKVWEPEKNGVARQLLARRDSQASGWAALADVFPGVATADRLNLDGCTALSDLRPLEKLASLRRLSFAGCTALSDLRPLEKLTHLDLLSLGGCTALSDLRPLEKLASLKTLYLGDLKDRFPETVARLQERKIKVD